jgi:hypothetical protein
MKKYFIYMKPLSLFKHRLQQKVWNLSFERREETGEELADYSVQWLLGPFEEGKKEKHVQHALLATDLPLKEVLDLAADLSSGDYLLVPVPSVEAVTGHEGLSLFLEEVSPKAAKAAREEADKYLKSGGAPEEAERLYCRLLAEQNRMQPHLLEEKESRLGHELLNPVEKGVLYRHRGEGDEKPLVSAKRNIYFDILKEKIRNGFHDISVRSLLDYITTHFPEAEAESLLKTMDKIARNYYEWYVYDDGCKDLDDTFKKPIDRKQFFLDSHYWSQRPDQMLIVMMKGEVDMKKAVQLISELKCKI